MRKMAIVLLIIPLLVIGGLLVARGWLLDLSAVDTIWSILYIALTSIAVLIGIVLAIRHHH